MAITSTKFYSDRAQVVKCDLNEILPYRGLYIQENNCQIRYDSCHVRNWSDSYLLIYGDQKVGYGSVKGKDDLTQRDAIFEFYLVPFWRREKYLFYEALIEASQCKFLECQTNDALHTSLVHYFGRNISSDTMLFADDCSTAHSLDDARVRLRKPEDLVFEKNKDAGAYVLLINDEIVASGGFLTHYNMPFADLYMEVRPGYRRRGYATYILQEIKKYCYLAGRVPAARCSIRNEASQRSLLKAGMRNCGHMLVAEL